MSQELGFFGAVGIAESGKYHHNTDLFLAINIYSTFLGLDKLTETLPDLNSHSSATNSGCTSTGGTPTYCSSTAPLPEIIPAVVESPKQEQQILQDRSRSRQPGGQYQSRDNYTGGLSTLKQPPQRPQQPQQQPQTSNNMEATLYQPYHTRADSKVSIICKAF